MNATTGKLSSSEVKCKISLQFRFQINKRLSGISSQNTLGKYTMQNIAHNLIKQSGSRLQFLFYMKHGKDFTLQRNIQQPPPQSAAHAHMLSSRIQTMTGPRLRISHHAKRRCNILYNLED